MSRPPRALLGPVPAAFHAGVQDILLIAFGLAWTEYLGTGSLLIGFDVEGHGRSEDLGGADLDLRHRSVAHGGLVHHRASGRVGNAGTALGPGGFG